MNCKQGEICRVTAGMTTTPEAVGYFVETVRIARHGELLEAARVDLSRATGPSWIVRGHAIPMRTSSGVLYFVSERAILDSLLRPIRNPGDDATDESHAWLPPVPTQTKEPA